LRFRSWAPIILALLRSSLLYLIG